MNPATEINLPPQVDGGQPRLYPGMYQQEAEELAKVAAGANRALALQTFGSQSDSLTDEIGNIRVWIYRHMVHFLTIHMGHHHSRSEHCRHPWPTSGQVVHRNA